MKVRILFYKAEWFDGHIVDDAIAVWTGLFNWNMPRYSHCEIWVADEFGNFQRIYSVSGRKQLEVYGTCYTSTMRGDNNGVVKRPAADVLKNHGRWDWYEVEVDGDTYAEIIDWMDNKVKNNKGYDKKAIWTFFLPFMIHAVDKYICSEFVKNAMCNEFFWGYDIDSPVRLAKRLDKMGIERKSV